MGPIVTFGPLLSRQLCIPATYVMALLVFVWLADLQYSDCMFGSDHRQSDPAHALLVNRELGSNQYPHKYFPQSRGSNTAQSHKALPAAARVGRTHDLRNRRRGRGVHNTETPADLKSKRAPPDVEVEALVAFKAAITTDPSNALGGWVMGAAAVNNSDTCSGWIGVTCSPESPNHVTALTLSNLQLEGPLAPALQALRQLKFLQSLDLSTNVFRGSIKGASLTNFSHLAYFNISQNGVTGEIPFEIGELVSLQTLDVSANTMSGQIPYSLANCSLLRSIEVGGNGLVGDIPVWLGTLSHLEYLNMSFNSLSGSIPGAIGNCSSLLLLDLGGNFKVGGVLPQEMSLLKQLEFIDMTDNVVSGAFPLWIGNLTSLTSFSLVGGFVEGEIPETIGKLKSLYWFQVGDNKMTGVIPLSIYNLTSLQTLLLYNIDLSGHIPPQLGMLPNLNFLLLATNQFTGVIPSSLANCSTLSVLQVGENPLMDPQPIPLWLGSLTNLTRLYLSIVNLQGELAKSSIGSLFNLEHLELAENNLTGTIPIALQNCSFLIHVDLGYNSLTGTIPQELGVLKYMFTFLVDTNYLSGSFPGVFANWTQLFNFNVGYNQLSGLLNGLVNIDQKQQLTWLSVQSNLFEGPIPETISNCTSINILDLGGNRLSGPIPASLGNLTDLQTLYLDINYLEGPIPVQLLKGSLQLRILYLSGNKLEGTIPLEIGQLVQLGELHLDNNNFTGTVPNSLGNCSRMNVLDLSSNQFEGNIPENAISQMSASLTDLNLSHNLFSGSWPKDFTHLSLVQSINVSYNNISGLIPLGLGLCVNLISLDISMNGLTGEIPDDLGSLAHLDFFNASFNNFTGPLPHSGIFNSNQINEFSFLGNPGLCGSTVTLGLHHQECGKIPLNVSIDHQHCKGFNCKQVWIPVAIASTLILLVAIFIIPGIKSWQVLRGGRRNDDFKTHVFLNFGAHVRITERDVVQTIDDPRGDNVIGVGARSIVYRGVSHDGRVFALKKILRNTHVEDAESNESSSTGVLHSELAKEAQMLAKLRHKNILKCLSFYSNLDLKALILEYMCKGSLHKHLHEVEPGTLTWQQRLTIAMGVAEGMKYLHHDFPEPLIHRDLKPSNILLDEDFEPKVGDFGISKFIGLQRDGEATASTFCGTIGYMPPEYASQTWVSTKGDVYSYGMVLIELLTQKQPCSMNFLETRSNGLRSWALDHFHMKSLELLNPTLIQECKLDEIDKEQMMLLLRVSIFCTREEPQSRPSMLSVVGMLTDIINLGVKPINWRRIEDLANDAIMGVSQNPTIEGAGLSSNC